MDLGTFFLVLAVPCFARGVALAMSMTNALHERGHRIHWPLLRLHLPRSIARYRSITAEESGRPAAPFHAFVALMGLALLLLALGLSLRG